MGEVATQTFTVAGPAIDPPDPRSPTPGGTAESITPTLEWSPVAGAIGYDLYISDPLYPPNAFASGIIPVTDTQYKPTSPLLNGHTYLWQVVAITMSGGVEQDSPPSSPAEFTVSAPGTPTSVAPAAGATVTTATPKFQWSAASGADGYDLYLQDTTTGTQVLDAFPVTGTSYTIVAPLVSGDSYSWYVRAYDNYGNVGNSSPNSFTVLVPPVPPATPNPTGPIGKVKGANPTFQWTAVPKAVGYALFVKDTTTGTIVYAGLPVSGTSYTPGTPLSNNDTYDWYVRAINSDGTLGPLPAGADFDVSVTAELAGPPTPESPSGTTTTTPTFQWSAVTHAAGYEIEILDTTNHTVGYVVYPTPVSGTSYTPGTPLTPGHTYQWQVLAYDSLGATSAWSSPTLFSIPRTTPTITWSNPASIVFGTALGAAQFDATANVPGTFTYSPPAGTVLRAGSGQTLSVLFTPTDTIRYASTGATAFLDVLPAMPTIIWANPADIVAGTALGAAQLDATASMPGTFTYSPAAGTVLSAGRNQTLSVLFTPADTIDYMSVRATVSLSVLPGTGVLPVTTPPPTITGERVVLTSPKHNKKGKPVISFAFIYSTAMDPGTVSDPRNYVVESATTRKVKKKVVVAYHSVGVLSASYSVTDHTVTIATSATQKAYAKGGRVRIIAAPPGGVSDAAGDALGGSTVFTITVRAGNLTS
jgi:hypothetical protein